MPKSSLTNKQKERIYQLSTEDGFSQSKLANLYDVSQGTISNALKDKRHEAELNELKKQQTVAMAMAVKAVIKEKELSKKNVSYIDIESNSI